MAAAARARARTRTASSAGRPRTGASSAASSDDGTSSEDEPLPDGYAESRWGYRPASHFGISEQVPFGAPMGEYMATLADESRLKRIGRLFLRAGVPPAHHMTAMRDAGIWAGDKKPRSERLAWGRGMYGMHGYVTNGIYDGLWNDREYDRYARPVPKKVSSAESARVRSMSCW